MNGQKKKPKKIKKRDNDERLLKSLHSISNSGPPPTASPVGGGGACFHCGQSGHVRAGCPGLEIQEIQRKYYADNSNRGNPSKRGKFSR